jgi:hypothetical protein
MITKEKLEKIRETRPLASLDKGWATGIPETRSPCTPPPADQAWGCLGPLVGGTRWVCTITAPSAFAARREAAVELGCEPYEVNLEAVDR